MEYWQHVLAYLILVAANVYLIRKFIWDPFKKKKKNKGGCGEEDCGCH